MAKARSPHNGMVHLNGNLLCAVDVETTGTVAGFHDLIQVAIVPLDANIRPIKTITPFYLNLTPLRPENVDPKALKVTKLSLAQIILNSMDPFKAADLFIEWFERLNLPMTANANARKRIAPLWSNGSFDKSFLMEWLTPEQYNEYFYFQERDTQALALSINDRYSHHAEPVPFPKVGVNYLASCFGVVNENAHDALSDCITTAEIYRRMLHMYMPIVSAAEKPAGPPVWFGKKGTEPWLQDDATPAMPPEPIVDLPNQ